MFCGMLSQVKDASVRLMLLWATRPIQRYIVQFTTHKGDCVAIIIAIRRRNSVSPLPEMAGRKLIPCIYLIKQLI